MFYTAFIFLSVCLSFCPYVSKFTWQLIRGSRNFLREMCLWRMKKWLKLTESHSHLAAAQELFEGFFNITTQGFFHTLAHISEKKQIGCSWKFLPDVSLNKEVPTKVWKASGSELLIRRLDSDRICLGGGLHSKCSRLLCYFYYY